MSKDIVSLTPKREKILLLIFFYHKILNKDVFAECGYTARARNYYKKNLARIHNFEGNNVDIGKFDSSSKTTYIRQVKTHAHSDRVVSTYAMNYECLVS